MNATKYPPITFQNSGNYVLHPSFVGDTFRAYTFARRYLGKFATLDGALIAIAKV